MAVDKKINYKIQGGVKNYKPSKMVTVPKIAKSSPDTPTAKLAYITPEEEKILIDLNLYGSLKGKPNRGPGGIPSLEGDFGGPGGFGGFQGGGDYSSAETGNSSGFDGTGSGPELPPGVTPTPSTEAQDIRNSFIAAGGGQRVNPGFFDSRNTVSPVELAMAKASNPSAFNQTRRGGIMDFITGGGIIGAGIRGLGQKLGLGKQYNQPTYDISEFNNYELGGSQTPTYYNDLDNELMLSTKETPSTLDLDKSPNKFNRMFNINNIASLIEASQGIDTSMYGADQDIYGVENARGLFRPYQQSTDFNTKYSPDGLTYYNNDEQPEGIIGIDVGYDNPAFENDSMVKLDNAETREKTTLQMGKDLGLNSPSQNEKLEQLKQKEKEAALNTTSIV